MFDGLQVMPNLTPCSSLAELRDFRTAPCIGLPAVVDFLKSLLELELELELTQNPYDTKANAAG